MSFIRYKSGWTRPNFLASEIGIRTKTRQIPQSMGTAVDCDKVAKAGTVFPSNDGSAQGILFEDVHVTSGDMPGAVMTAGEVYVDQLPASPSAEAQAAMEKTGLVFLPAKPVITRD